MILSLFVGMILKLLNIFLKLVLLHWLCGINLAFTFKMLPSIDLDLMYLILLLESFHFKKQTK